ncbi:hypothetical protein ABZ892_01985 [Streptomyces sp. NPDC046924]|uniref:hypothetical protein n=1 Tax=Streptomyces sp. NPDC046924 TaxID=3155136 RepID=UPI0033D5D16F
MEKWREGAQPDRSETASASEGDHGSWFSRSAADRAAEPEPRPYAATRDDWPYPYDTSAVTRPMDGTPAADGTRRTPVQRGPQGALRDPWQEDDPATAVLPPAPAAPADNAADAPDTAADDTAGRTHDPHEVTIQLDAVQIGNGALLGTPDRSGDGAVHEPSDGPVFVDESGRRGRRYRRIGLALGLACAAYAVVIVATLLSGNSDAPWVPVPDQEQGQPAEKAETSPRPAEPDASPDADVVPDPGTGPTAGEPDPATPSDAGLPAGGGTAAGDGAVEPAAPSPTPSAGTTPKPGAGASSTAPADPPAGPEPTATPTPSGGASTAPASPPAGEDPGDEEPAGADNLARAPADPPTVAAESPAAPPTPSTAPAAPSPEHVL